jgi:hypothetical protein
MTTFALARLAKRARIGHNALWLRAKSSPSKGKAMATGFDESDEIFDPDSASAAYDTRPPRRSPEMPIFSRVVLIIDMVLCGFRLAVVALGVVGYVVLKQQNNLQSTSAVFEIVTGTGIVIFGLSGDLLLLLKQRWALLLAIASLVFTLASIGIGIWQMSNMYGAMAGNDAARQVGYVVGGVFTLMVRVGIVVAYGVALAKYATWSSRLSMVD